MNIAIKHRTSTLISLAAALLILNACSNDTSSASVDSSGKSTINMNVPAFLNTRAIDFTTLEPIVMINNQTINLTSSGGQWSGATAVPVNQDATLSVQWVEINTGLLLARAEKTAPMVNNNIDLEILDSDYITEGADFDADQDTISNIAERRQDTDPNDANSPGTQPPPLVKVRASRRTTTIDGTVKDGTSFWNLATYSDVNGEDLRVNNLIVDETDNYIDQAPDYQWGAIHDGRFLTLLIYGKSIGAGQISAGTGTIVQANGDSGNNLFNDDSLEIFIDGNLSELDDYDFVDDMHLIIPLVMGSDDAPVANRSSSPDKRIQRGTNVQSVVVFDPFDEEMVEFASCLCVGAGERVTWEVRLDMEALNIPIGQTFGFEIQINQDDDGEGRDAKWAWFAPSRQPGQINAETDATWVHPNLMGQIQLLGFPE